jgi:hypothetical protein
MRLFPFHLKNSYMEECKMEQMCVKMTMMTCMERMMCEMNCMKMMMEQMCDMNMEMNMDQMMLKMQKCDEMMTIRSHSNQLLNLHRRSKNKKSHKCDPLFPPKHLLAEEAINFYNSPYNN